MATLYIGAMGFKKEAEGRFSEVKVSEKISRKMISYYLFGDNNEDLLKRVEEASKVEPLKLEKPNKKGFSLFYKIEDLPLIIGAAQNLPDYDCPEYFKKVDVSAPQFEIVFPTGSRMRFTKE